MEETKNYVSSVKNLFNFLYNNRKKEEVTSLLFAEYRCYFFQCIKERGSLDKKKIEAPEFRIDKEYPPDIAKDIRIFEDKCFKIFSNSIRTETGRIKANFVNIKTNIN